MNSNEYRPPFVFFMGGLKTMRVARPVVLSPEQREELETRARVRSASARSVERARIVLMAGAGMQDRRIAAELRITPEKAARWRNRFLDGGLAALDKDAPRPGRTPTITLAKIQEVVRKTTREKPGNATHRSTRRMAQAVGVSEKSVRRIWRRHGLKPHLSRTFKLSNDPEFAEKLLDPLLLVKGVQKIPRRSRAGRLMPQHLGQAAVFTQALEIIPRFSAQCVQYQEALCVGRLVESALALLHLQARLAVGALPTRRADQNPLKTSPSPAVSFTERFTR